MVDFFSCTMHTCKFLNESFTSIQGCIRKLIEYKGMRSEGKRKKRMYIQKVLVSKLYICYSDEDLNATVSVGRIGVILYLRSRLK